MEPPSTIGIGVERIETAFKIVLDQFIRERSKTWTPAAAQDSDPGHPPIQMAKYLCYSQRNILGLDVCWISSKLLS